MTRPYGRGVARYIQDWSPRVSGPVKTYAREEAVEAGPGVQLSGEGHQGSRATARRRTRQPRVPRSLRGGPAST